MRRDHAIVVGAGPAGLMAAERLAASGAAVTVIDHRRSAGRKLVLAGRSGLNLTNRQPLGEFLDQYQASGSLIVDAVTSFSPDALRRWAEALGIETFIGSSGRVFPLGLSARPLLRAWLERLDQNGVRFAFGLRWQGWDNPDNTTRLRFVATRGEAAPQGDESNPAPVTYDADAVVLACGGASWPQVSSAGGWAATLLQAGVRVTTLEPSNCGVIVPWSDVFVDRFEGVPIKNVAVRTTSKNGPGNGRPTTQCRHRGDLTVTKDGLEGGPVYAVASALGEHLSHESATIELDLFPDLDHEALAHRLRKRRAKQSWSTWLRNARFSPVATSLLRETNGERPTTPDAVAALAKALPLTVTALAPLERAISTRGGLRLEELDERFMIRSHPGVFAAGEMLDWDAPTGGYLLQGCFATGASAADGALAWMAERGASTAWD